MRPALDIATPLPAQKPVDIVGAVPVGGVELCLGEFWTQDEYDALEWARLQRLGSLTRESRAYDCFEVIDAAHRLELPDGRSYDEHFKLGFLGLLLASVSNADLTPRLRDGCRSAWARLVSASDRYWEQFLSPSSDWSWLECQAMTGGRSRTLAWLPGRRPFRRCERTFAPFSIPKDDPPPFDPPVLGDHPQPAPSPSLQVPGLVPVPPVPPGTLAPDLTLAILIERQRHDAELALVHARIILNGMTPAMRLQAVQCWFPGATQEQADRVAAGFQCAAEHLDTASVVFVPNSGGGTPAGPPADQRWWDRIAEDTAARGLTVFAFTVTSPGPGELARPIALWYIALLEPWARLPEPEQVRVLAHEGLHFCRFEIGGVSAPLEHHDTEALLNVNRWEGLMDDLNGFPLRAGLPPRSFLCP